jgi:DNA invertase Pin-like site-specific DNA recombinase
MSFLQNQKTEIGTDKSQWCDKIICLRYERFSRSFEQSLSVIGQLGRMGIEIEMVESNIEMTSPESLLTRNIMLTLPEIENIKIGLRSREGSWKCRMSGGWTGKSPRGYNNVRINNISSLEINQDSELIRESFEKVSSGRYSIDEVRRWINSKGIEISKNQMLNVLRNITYTGKILIPPFKDNPETIVDGLHQPIVSDELFSNVQQVLLGRKRKMTFKLDKSDLYPLKGYMKCPIHNRTLSAYGSKGRKLIYHYYICTFPRGKCQRYPIDWTHQYFINLLERIVSSVKLILKRRDLFEVIIQNESNLRLKVIHNIENQLITSRGQLNHLRQEFLFGRINGDTYQELKTEVESSIYETEISLRNIHEENTPMKKFLFEDTPRLLDLVGFYNQVNGTMKRKILNCIFSEKVYFDTNKDAIVKYTRPIDVILSITEGLVSKDKKKQVNYDLFSQFAPLINDSCNMNPMSDYVILHRTWFKKQQ